MSACASRCLQLCSLTSYSLLGSYIAKIYKIQNLVFLYKFGFSEQIIDSLLSLDILLEKGAAGKKHFERFFSLAIYGSLL